MVNKREKDEMMDYLAARIAASGLNVQPSRKEVLAGCGESSYILVGNKEGLVLLVDGAYHNDTLNNLYRGINRTMANLAIVVFKDGKTFFRSAMGDQEVTGIQSKRFKQKYGLSLKEYRNEELQRMISFRPEEEFLSTEKGVVQYYQPASDRLEQGIVTFKFKPVVFDYSHIAREDRYTNVQEESKRLRIWTERWFNSGLIRVDGGFLKKVKDEKKAE